MSPAVTDLQLDIREGLATLTFDRPDAKVNLLSRVAMLRLDELLVSIEERASGGEVRAVLIRSGKRGNFIAGADIDELLDLETASEAEQVSRRGQGILRRLDDLPVPTLAAIDGGCVGGGLELALACDYRVASKHPRTRLGLPETQLGILPGLGGTVRLPRLIGLQPALELILSGKQISADRAARIGLVDRLIESDLFDSNVSDLAEQLARGQRPLRRHTRSLFDRLIKDGAVARWIIKWASRKRVEARTRGHYPAPPLALELTVDGLGLPPDEAYALEAEAFGRLAVTPECKNLIFVYRLTERARKAAPPGKPRSVGRGAVIGAGVMGAGIAELFAYQEIPVTVVDIDDDRVRAGLDRARGLLDKAARRSNWSESALRRRIDCLGGSTDYDGLEGVDLVIEAVVERSEVKKRVFGRLEESIAPEAVIATNTSALSVTDLQRDRRHPGRFCGLHFFNPPYRMPLVEVVRGSATSDDTVATAFDFAVRLGKTPVLVEDSPGFVVNRILAAYLTEAGHLLQQGLAVETLDRAIQRFGMPVGPARLLDEIGLDVVAEVGETMQDAFGDRFAPALAMKEVLATGVTGRKGGIGFYRYSDSEPGGVNPEIERLLEETRTASPPGDEEAIERLILVMINEAARTLDDGVIDSPDGVDVAMIMGTGFPPFRGGLLRHADSIGLDHVVARLRHHAQATGPRFEPARGLLQRSSFYQ